MVDSHVMCDVG